MKEPKKYECLECGFISKRCKVYRPNPNIGFAICFKCRGRVKERQEWLDWLYAARDRHIKEAIKYNNGYIMGVDITK
jgi:transcription elongation factor Elf1